MNNYKIIQSPKFLKQLKKIDKKIIKKIIDFIYPILRNNPVNGNNNIIELKGKNLASCYRYRIGNYRLLYEVDKDNLIVNILSIQHRKEVYK